MEVLLTFEGSRRVIKVEEGSSLSLLRAIEKDLGERFPDRDIALSPGELPLPKSSSKDIHFVQRLTKKWGFVDVTDFSQIQNGDELTLVKIDKRSPGESSGTSVSPPYILCSYVYVCMLLLVAGLLTGSLYPVLCLV